MSAANVVLEPYAAHLFTDSAAVDGLGRVRRLVSKVRILPGGRCAFTARGFAGVSDVLAEVLPTLGTTVDALHAAAADGRLGAALGRWASLRHGRWALLAPFDCTVVGWGRDGPRAFLFWSHNLMRSDDGAPVEARFTPRDIPRANVLPAAPLPACAIVDPLAHMAEILDRQHRMRDPSLLVPGGRRTVGGFVEHTLVTEAGVRTRRAGGWDDPVGQAIGGGMSGWRARRRIALVLGAAFVAGEAAQLFITVLWKLARAAWWG